MRKCEVLSMTTAPAFVARGAKTADTLAPGEERTISIPRKSKVSRPWTLSTSSSPNDTSRPIDRDDANATTSSAGNSRSASVVSISRPTLPVPPTTAPLNPISNPRGQIGGLWRLSYDARRCITRTACHDLSGVLAALPVGACGPAHARIALFRHDPGGSLGRRGGRAARLALAARRGGRRLRLRLAPPSRIRAQQARDIPASGLVADQRFSYARPVLIW